MHYFNFKTSNIEDSCVILKERGVSVSEIYDAGNIRTAYFHDPDGNLLGMCESI